MKTFSVLMLLVGLFFTDVSLQATSCSIVKGKAACGAKATVKSKNLASKKTYVSSDNNPWGWRGLTDGAWGVSSKTCFATKDTKKFPKYVTIDLEEKVKLSKVKLGVPPFGSTKTVDIEVSVDGKSFKKVGSVVFQQKKSERKTVTFPTIEAKYLRLAFPDYHQKKVIYPPEFIFITEVEAYEK